MMKFPSVPHSPQGRMNDTPASNTNIIYHVLYICIKCVVVETPKMTLCYGQST